MNRILCIHLPNWPVQRVIVARPELENCPVVLYAHLHPRGQRVLACSAAACRYGVRTGMPLAESAALLERAELRGQKSGVKTRGGPAAAPIRTRGEACCLEYDPAADREALQQLAHACERFSPLVGLEQAAEPTDLLLDITGLVPIFGSEQRLAGHVAENFQRRGYQVRIAIADTVGAAWAMAHYGMRNEEGGSRNGVRNAECGMRNDEQVMPPEAATSDSPVPHSAFRLPHSDFHLPPRHGLAPLGDLPVAALRLPDDTVQLLAKLGVQRIGELAALPRASLSSRFGDTPARRLDQMAGTVDEVITTLRPVEDFGARWALEYPTHNRQAIEVIVTRLVERVARRLADCDRGVIQLECRLACGKQPQQISIGLFDPTAAASHLMQLLRMQLDRIALPQPVQEVCVQATTTTRLRQRQGELFGDESQRRPKQLAVLIDRLSSRLGRHRVVRPGLLDEAQPERSWRYLPLAGELDSRAGRTSSTNRRRKTNTPGSAHLPSPARSRRRQEFTATSRPLRIHSPPISLEVMAVVPDGPPVRFTLHRQSYHIARYWGPERIETGWWRGGSVRRDYYRVETDSGHRFWMFRQLTDGAWFLHGEFE